MALWNVSGASWRHVWSRTTHAEMPVTALAVLPDCPVVVATNAAGLVATLPMAGARGASKRAWVLVSLLVISIIFLAVWFSALAAACSGESSAAGCPAAVEWLSTGMGWKHAAASPVMQRHDRSDEL